MSERKVLERRTYSLDAPGGRVREDVAHIEPCERTMEEILAEAPVGSTVVWQSVDAPADHEFARVPSVKLGADEFAAHGLAEDRHVFTRAQITRALQEKLGVPSTEGAEERVFVASVEIVEPY